MARSHARWKLGSFSSDPDLKAATPHEKLLYVFLVQDSYLNAAGVLMMCEQVWAEDCGFTDDEIEKALRGLIERRFVVVDWRTRELLVRSFVRNDGIADQPNVLKQALAHARLARSPQIRKALATELRRLPEAPPNKVDPDGRVRMVYPDPHGCANELDPLPDPPPKGSEPVPQQGSGNPSGNPVQDGFLDGMPEPQGRGRGKVRGSTSRSAVQQFPSSAGAAEAPTNLDDGFDEFWAVFPRREQKRDALKAWRQMRREKIRPERLIDGARGYAAFVLAENRTRDKIKLPASWLRAGGYDDHQPPRPATPDTRDPVDVLRSLWQAADGVAVARILRIPWMEPQQSPDDGTDYEKWIIQARRDWISDHHEAAVTALAEQRESA